MPPDACPKCPVPRTNCDLQPVSRVRKKETVESVVYVEQKIKKFDREGSESIEIARIPEFVEEHVEIDIVTYRCDVCGYTVHVREELRKHSDPTKH